MRVKLTILLLISSILFLSGCAETSAIKAPCNASGSNCTPRIKINQWDNQQ
jgi:outer membrane lipoprotein-sorting protein